ncbi:MAG: hypothetical protein HC892_12960 [Saprospiraceae bacterium]|nr:hypothetical protein [Saprospiraceae bacterium]
MKKLFALFILTSWLGTIYAIDYQKIIPPLNDKLSVGYIITLDGKRLTGQIGDVSYSNIISNVEFVNDFGTPYQLRAELIRGFVFFRTIAWWNTKVFTKMNLAVGLISR